MSSHADAVVQYLIDQVIGITCQRERRYLELLLKAGHLGRCLMFLWEDGRPGSDVVRGRIGQLISLRRHILINGAVHDLWCCAAVVKI